MNVGIVGAEEAKFTAEGEAKAREIIRRLLQALNQPVLVSGKCHLGGIDAWAEEEADKLGLQKMIFPPAHHAWSTGYKPRNILIAQTSHVVHNIVVAKYPGGFDGMRFEICYHCRNRSHVKSGGCWTAHYAQQLGKMAYWHIV